MRHILLESMDPSLSLEHLCTTYMLVFSEKTVTKLFQPDQFSDLSQRHSGFQQWLALNSRVSDNVTI